MKNLRVLNERDMAAYVSTKKCHARNGHVATEKCHVRNGL